jgi:hypothetical protein
MVSHSKEKVLLLLLSMVTGLLPAADSFQAPPAPFAAEKIIQSVPEIRETDTMVSNGCSAAPAKKTGVFCGGSSLILNLANPAEQFLVINGHPSGAFDCWGSSEFGSGHPFKGGAPVVSTDAAERMVTVTKRFFAGAPAAGEDAKKDGFPYGILPGGQNGADGVFTECVKILDDGLVEMKYNIETPPGAKIRDFVLFMNFYPFRVVDGAKLLIDSKPYAFSADSAPFGDRTIFDGTAESAVFFPDRPDRKFSLLFPAKTRLSIKESRNEKDKGNQYKYSASMRVYPADGKNIALRLDMRGVSEESLKKSDTFAGINFWQCDRLHIPDYAKCRNLAQNPSFEAGLRYWMINDCWARHKERGKPVFSIDGEVSKFGNSSLRINTMKGDTEPGYLHTFAVPVVPGKKYTVSFYARGDRAGGAWINTRCVTAQWGKFPQTPGFGVSKDWERRQFTVTAPNSALIIMLSAAYQGDSPSGEGAVWIDGFQIEEGETASEYTERPLSAELLTSSPDNFLSVENKEINARLKITAAPDTEGSVKCVLEDFFCVPVWEGKFDFKTDGKGIATVSLPMDRALGAGVYVLLADFRLKTGFEDSDYFRISRMKFLENTHKNKNICATDIPANNFRCDDIMRRCRDIGFGSANYAFHGHNIGRKDYFDRLAKYGIAQCCEGLTSRGIFHQKLLSENFSLLETVTPEIEKKAEDAAFEIAKSCPWVEAWDLGSELESSWKMVKNGSFDDFARLQMACYKGVKRFDPNKKFYLGGTCDMMPQGGTRFVNSYLEALGAIDSSVKFDGVTTHPYRTTPESPDLDDDTAYFLSVLDKNGWGHKPVFWEEGIYYTYYNIPEWGLDPHKGCSSDHYNCAAACPSYHMGWGERISAAYYARSWLVALKYQDRVKQFNGWCGWFYMDSNLTPFALQKIPNTLGNLLGNAVFKKDIRFAPETRCYVFEDEKKRPVAALWSHNPKVDRGFEKCPEAEFDFSGMSPEIFDLMENAHPVKAGSRAVLPVSSFPVFVRGEAGSLDKLCAAFQGGRVLNSDKAVLSLAAKPSGTQTLEVTVRNLVTRPWRGAAVFNIQGKNVEKELSLGPKGTETLTLGMPSPIPFDRISAVSLPAELFEKGSKPMKTDLSLSAFAVRKTAGAPAWENIPAIKISNRNILKTAGGTNNIPINEKVGYGGDFEAEYQMAWDDSGLYLRVSVTDDVFYHDANKKSVDSRYDNDSLQVYIDTLCNARSKETKGFDGDDYNYDFFPNMKTGSVSEPDGTVTVFRRFAPEQQAAGGLFAPKPNMVEPGVKAVFKKTDKGYVYDITFPKDLVAPLRLGPGVAAGFCLYLNDHDGKCVKSGLSTTTVPGTGGYMNPHLYPVMLLAD